MNRENVLSWESVFVTYSDMVFKTALKILRNDDAARDIVQEAFLKYGLNPTKIENPQSWLRRVARNLSISMCRRRRFQGIDGVDFIGSFDAHALEKEEFIERIDKTVFDLDAKYRDVLIDNANGFSMAQTAVKRSIPIGTACSRLDVARGIMRRKLERYA